MSKLGSLLLFEGISCTCYFTTGFPAKWVSQLVYIYYIYIYIYIYIYLTWCTGTLDELVASHTKVAIYPAYTICFKRL